MKFLTYNFIKNTFYIIIVLLIVYLVYNSYQIIKFKKEGFNSFISNEIKLSTEVINPLLISAGKKNGINDLFSKKLSVKFPLEILNHNEYDLKNMENLIKNVSDIAISNMNIISLDQFKNNNNIRYICDLFPNHITLIINKNSGIKDWKNLTNTSICIGTINSFSNIFFKQLIEKLNYNNKDINIIEDDIFSTKIITNFKNNLISALFIITPHPILEINNLYEQFNNIEIIGTKGINDLIMKNFPNFKLSSIQINECGNVDIKDCASYKFNNIQNNFIKSYSIQSSLFAKKDISNETIFKLTETILNNVQSFRIPENTDNSKDRERQLFFKQIFNKISKSNLIFYPKNIKIHDGSSNYYKSIGLITNEKNIKCANYMDKTKCTEDILQRPTYGNASIGQVSKITLSDVDTYKKEKEYEMITKSKNCSPDLIEKCENKCNIDSSLNNTKELCLQNNKIPIDPSQININKNTITLLNHKFKTGDSIIYNNGNDENIFGLENKQKYFVYKVDNNTIQLCSSKKDALNLVGKYRFYQVYGYLNNDGFYRNAFGNFLYNGIPKKEYVTGILVYEDDLSSNVEKGRFIQFQIDDNNQSFFSPESKIMDVKEFIPPGGKTKKLIQISFQNNENTTLKKKITLLPDTNKDKIVNFLTSGNSKQFIETDIYKWIKSGKICYENNCVEQEFANCELCKKTMGSEKCVNVCSALKRGFQNHNCSKEQIFECEQKGQLCYNGNVKPSDYCVDDLQKKRSCDICKEMNYTDCSELCFDKYTKLLKLGLDYNIFQRVGNKVIIGNNTAYPSIIISNPDKYFTKKIMKELNKIVV